MFGYNKWRSLKENCIKLNLLNNNNSLVLDKVVKNPGNTLEDIEIIINSFHEASNRKEKRNILKKYLQYTRKMSNK